MKFKGVEEVLTDALDIDEERVYAAWISKPGNLTVRLDQSRRSQRADIALALIPDHGDLAASAESAAARVADGSKQAIVLTVPDETGTWSVSTVLVRSGNPLMADLAALLPDAELTTVEPSHGVARSRAGVEPVVLDVRLERLARVTLRSASAVFFIGPPGVGKGALVDQLVREAKSDPEDFGLSEAPSLRRVTLDDSWTTLKLVGGETVDDDGRLRFRPGAVLEAIRDDEWLLLDEANRGDLDRIFGGLMTFLSGQDVVVGRAATTLGAPPVVLGWRDNPHSLAVGLDRLDEADPGTDPIQVRAGSNWRLLGTYNPVDAHQVFRPGIALGRRFRTVPVPPAETTVFAGLLGDRTDDLPTAYRDHVQQRIAGLYAAHLETERAVLGPAMFLDIPGYVAAALDSSHLDLGEPPEEGTALDPEITEILDDIVVEGYVGTTGSWLSRLEPQELDELGIALTQDEVLSPENWNWVRYLLQMLE